MKTPIVIGLAWMLALGVCAAEKASPMTPEAPPKTGHQLATFGGGCFWCVEAAFELLEGVTAVTSGYAGGQTENPTYKAVCSGETGHAEVVQVEFDPRKITYERLLEVFWTLHDPTTLNRQGHDVGTQYRSVIFYHDEAQRAAAEKSRVAAAKAFSRPVVTEIAPLKKYYLAEAYHQDYFRLNPGQGYCQMVIAPKIKKLKQELAK
jgi:peptide-methionine (S)-S-oxide reductase